MTEYWVSQAKYYCKYCNMWMADNKISRQNHDSGPKHKASVEIFNRKKREEKLHGAKNEKDLQQQLAAIERAATLAMVQDVAAPSSQSPSIGPAPHPSMIQESQHRYAQRPPPSMPMANAPGWAMPQPAPSRPQYNVPFQVAKPLSEAAMAAVSENLRKDNSGSYTVRGVTYLEGPYYEHRLKAGVACEVFIEELDDWVSGKVVRRHNPDLATKAPLRLDIAYTTSEKSEDSETKEQMAMSVTSDQIRLIDVPPVGGVASGSIPLANLDANTGVGKWTTVSVTVINEDEEEKKRKAAMLEEEEEKKRAEAEKKKTDKWAELEGIGRDDALGSFDPYNTGMYKGVSVGGDMVEAELKPISDGKEIGFKKRKVSHNRKSSKVTSLDD